MADTTTPTTTYPPTLEDLKKQLDTFKTDLEKKQSSTVAVSIEGETLKAGIAELTKIIGDIEKRIKEFEKGAEDLAENKQALETDLHNQIQMLEPVVNEVDIKKRKDNAEKVLKDIADLLTAEAAKVVTYTKALIDAKVVTAEKQAAFDELMTRHNVILKDIGALQKLAKDEVGNAGRVYFLVLLIKDRLAKLTPSGPAEYKKELVAAAEALRKQTGEERAAKENLDKAVETEKQLRKKLQDERATWRQRTLSQIPEGTVADKPKPGPAVPSPG